MASKSWNKVELIGNLTRDPELRYTPNGAAVATFSIATNRSYLVEGERKEEADFHRIVAWNKLAELCSQLLKKGTRVFVSGRLQNRSWEGTDGAQRQTTEIVIEDMIILNSKSGGTEDFSGDVTAEKSSVVSSQSSEKEEKTKEVEEPKDAKVEEKTEKEEKAPKSEKPESEEPDLDDLPF